MPVGDVVKAEYTASDCSCERMADSLACAPYCIVIPESIWAVADESADPGPELPVYQDTVLALPLTSDVAELNGDPETRNGGCGAVTVLLLKPSACSAAGGVTCDRQARGIVGVDLDLAAVDGRRRRGARDLSRSSYSSV